MAWNTDYTSGDNFGGLITGTSSPTATLEPGGFGSGVSSGGSDWDWLKDGAQSWVTTLGNLGLMSAAQKWGLNVGSPNVMIDPRTGQVVPQGVPTNQYGMGQPGQSGGPNLLILGGLAVGVLVLVLALKD